jgi:hypothetical protein
MAQEDLESIRGLLVEIRDLLAVVADDYRPSFERRRAIRSVLSTDKRMQAWKLADGSRTQREIAQAAGMDEGGASRFFKSLRDIDAISDSPNPVRSIEVG